MKIRLTLLSLIMGLFLVNSNAQTNNEAAEYMYEVTKKTFELDDETWDYLKAVTRGKKASKVEDKRQELTRAIKTAKLSTARRKDFNGNSQLRDAIVDYLDLKYTVLKEDYDKILDMEAIAEESYDGMEAYLTAQERAGKKLDSAFQVMYTAQKLFADKYEITLNENRDKQTEKIRKAAEVLEYYNDVYLIFFKSFKQEAYLIDAISRGDLNSIEQNNSSLNAFSKEGLNTLKTFKSFKGDITLVNAAKKVLDFYQKESEEDLNTISEFFIKKDEFEKINKRIEAMSNKERTKAVIDKYNAAVNDYNASNTNYNNLLQERNKERNKILNDWYKKIDFFISNHSK